MAEYLSEEDMSTGEYISRDDTLKAIHQYCKDCDNCNSVMCRACDSADAMDIVLDIPKANVQPVKHGYWSECYTDSHHYSGICSVCGGGAIRKVKGKPLDYCPNCGARMNGDAE